MKTTALICLAAILVSCTVPPPSTTLQTSTDPDSAGIAVPAEDLDPEVEPAPEPVLEEPVVKEAPQLELVEPTEPISLFNGTDLDGWEQIAKDDVDHAGMFAVDAGIMKCSGGPTGYIRTDKAYKNYLLTIEWRYLEAGNTGVLIHTNGPDSVWPTSLECQGKYGNQGDLIAFDGVDFKERADKTSRRVAKAGDSNERPLGEWNLYEIVCDGDSVTNYVNGRRMNAATECTLSQGAISLQSEGAQWECRKITVEPVPERELYPSESVELFNGTDLDGWEIVLAGDADAAGTFSVEDGLIKCKGAPPGYMRTKAEYDNYMLRLEWRFLKPGNSGVLVHMSLPDKVWPKSIECQGMSDNQGDFFVIDGTDFREHREVEGRRVAKRGDSNENPLGQWNIYEIVCRGDAVRPYVNGQLMNEATECTVTGGYICIQSESAVWEARKVTLMPVPAREPSSSGGRLSGPYPPTILPRSGLITEGAAVTIRTGTGGEIRYTLDGSEPSKDTLLYADPFALSATTTVKARLYLPGGQASAVSMREFKLLPAVPPLPDVYISDLTPIKAVSGWGGDPKMDKSIEGNPLSVGGQRHAKGIGTHALSELIFALEPNYERFVSVVGNDDEASGRGGTMVYQVFADDKLLTETPAVAGNGYWHINVEIPAGAVKLRLLVGDAGDGIGCDHGDWASAGFVLRE